MSLSVSKIKCNTMQPTFGNQTLPPAVASENMSTGTKVGLVTALTALAVAGVYIATRGKVKNKPSNFSKVCEEVCEEVKGEVVNNNKPNWVLVDKPSKTTRGKVKNKVLNSLRKRGGKVKNKVLNSLRKRGGKVKNRIK